MGERPSLNNKLDSNIFRSYYYLKEELVEFCRQEELQTTGGKIELTDRIARYLATGEKQFVKASTKRIANIGVISEDTIIENNFVCSEKHRAFFKGVIGNSFSFNVLFQNWLKENSGKTYKDAIAAYYQILADKKKGKTQIDKQFEYNTYVRDFFTDNSGKTLEQAIQCWKYKKALQGHNRYEKQDLTAID